MLFMRPMKETDSFPGLAGPESGELYFVALNGDTLEGWCRYRKEGNTVHILEIRDGGDLMLMDGLLRAVFNYMEEIGVDRAQLSPELDAARLKALMVPVDGKNCVNSIKDFLYNCKKCKMLGNHL
ncbi:MAG: hypothetical protein PUC47_08960 [Oscillospiraceae bacterium]|nr:hypothetical protein [Oscillospiraceae bacterium]